MQRRYWTIHEDQALRTIVQSMSEPNWTMISLKLKAKVSGSDRNAKQCRQRWLNKVAKNNSEEMPWSNDQDRIILQQFIRNHRVEKNKWIIVSDRLNKAYSKDSCNSKRTPNEIKNRFYSVIRKGIRRINNKLGRPILPEEIRLIKPITISKLLDNMEQQNCQEMIEIVYTMAQDNTSTSSNQSSLENKRLSEILEIIISQNREQAAELQMRQCLKSGQKGQLKKRKSSLSTLDQERVEKINLSISNTLTIQSSTQKEEEQQNKNVIPIYNRCDDIDLFLGSYIGDSHSLQFEEIDFGI